MTEWMAIGLAAASLLLLLWLAFRLTDTGAADRSAERIGQRVSERVERLERDLRDELARLSLAQRGDLGSFQHVHPVMSGDGTWTTEVKGDPKPVALQ